MGVPYQMKTKATRRRLSRSSGTKLASLIAQLLVNGFHATFRVCFFAFELIAQFLIGIGIGAKLGWEDVQAFRQQQKDVQQCKELRRTNAIIHARVMGSSIEQDQK